MRLHSGDNDRRAEFKRLITAGAGRTNVDGLAGEDGGLLVLVDPAGKNQDSQTRHVVDRLRSPVAYLGASGKPSD